MKQEAPLEVLEVRWTNGMLRTSKKDEKESPSLMVTYQSILKYFTLKCLSYGSILNV